MAKANHGIVLWAVPRFHRPVRQLSLRGLGRPVLYGDNALETGMLKAVVEGIAENPDAAAHLYSSHMWRRNAEPPAEAAQLPRLL